MRYQLELKQTSEEKDGGNYAIKLHGKEIATIDITGGSLDFTYYTSNGLYEEKNLIEINENGFISSEIVDI